MKIFFVRDAAVTSLLLLMFSVLMATTATAGTSLPVRQEIIDMHCHAAGIGAGNSGCYVSPALRKSWKFRIYLNAFGVTEKELGKVGDGLIIERLSRLLAQSSVDKAVVLALDGVVGEDGGIDLSKTEIYVPNEFVAREVKKYPNLYYGASINPYRKDALARLEKAAADGAVLVKWLPSIQHIDPADPRLIPFYLRMKELGIPLLTHAGEEHSFTRADNHLADPERLRLPLELGVTVIAAHAATSGKTDGVANFERILPLFRTYPNLYADISSLTQINKLGHLKKVLKQDGIKERLLYGTDMPLLNTKLVSPFFFAFSLPIRQLFSIARIQNPWDRDLALKRALGVPKEVFSRAGHILRIQKPQLFPCQPKTIDFFPQTLFNSIFI